MKIASSDSFAVYDTTHRVKNIFPKNSLYMVRSLGIESDEYNVVVPYPNGYYYARLHHLTRDKTDRAGVVLISPQTASDETPPVISNMDNLRIPVYSKMTFPFSEIISELSGFSTLIDVDTSVDSDGNGVYDDDFVHDGE